MAAPPRINTLVIDALDPVRLSEFWSSVLGRPIAGGVGPYVWLQRADSLGVAFQKVSAVKSAKNRVHLDLESDDPDLERQRIESLGGAHLPIYDDGGFLVMADPEGNEFCIIPRGPFDVDDTGHADYLSDGGRSIEW